MMNPNASKILLIEDNESLRSSVQEILTFSGYTVCSAENGLAGLNKAYQFHPDVIICDIMMPEMDGYEVLKHVRETLGMAHTRFIFSSAKSQHEDLRHGMEIGADDYLIKPFATSSLLRSIEQQLSKKHTQQAVTQKRLDNLTGQLATTLPHELRTPLTTIVGFVDLLLEDTQDEQTRAIMLMMRDASQRMWRLIENYVIYSQIMLNANNEKWQRGLRAQTAPNTKEIIGYEIQALATKYERTDDLRLSLCDDTPLSIGENNLRKIVSELIDNAFKFSKPGQSITIITRRHEQHFWFEITDCGRGMTSEQIEQIGAYTQFDRERYEQQGSGLGLTIARLLSELHGGNLNIHSQRGGPTTISLVLDCVPKNAGVSA